jgi:hypothetical protein
MGQSIKVYFQMIPHVPLCRESSILPFARNNLSSLLHRFTGFPARFARFLLNFSIQALGYTFGFEIGSLINSRVLSLTAPSIDLLLPWPLFLIIVSFK